LQLIRDRNSIAKPYKTVELENHCKESANTILRRIAITIAIGKPLQNQCTSIGIVNTPKLLQINCIINSVKISLQINDNRPLQIFY